MMECGISVASLEHGEKEGLRRPWLHFKNICCGVSNKWNQMKRLVELPRSRRS